MLNHHQQTIGIVAEYNPFHNGHAWQLELTRRQFPNARIIAVISGNFVQRGQPAILDKWQRAKLAVECGIDLVLELPFSFACRSAEHFARGSVGILNALGVVDILIFGTECSDLQELQLIAQQSIQPETVTKLKEYMKSGLSYPLALQSALFDSGITINNTSSYPNNILAIEYLKQLILLNSPIKPQLILRHAAAYKSTTIDGPIASATAIRKHLAQPMMSNTVAATLPNASIQTINNSLHNGTVVLENNAELSLLCIYVLRHATADYLRTYTDVSEGLEYKILKNAAVFNNLNELTTSLVNKRYTHSRISRIIMQALVGMNKATHPTYIRPLAFNTSGRAILAQIKETATLPLIAKLGRDLANLSPQLQNCQLLKTEINSSNIYQMLLVNASGVHNLDFLQSPYFIN